MKKYFALCALFFLTTPTPVFAQKTPAEEYIQMLSEANVAKLDAKEIKKIVNELLENEHGACFEELTSTIVIAAGLFIPVALFAYFQKGSVDAEAFDLGVIPHVPFSWLKLDFGLGQDCT
ncbi:hypothetical protein K2W90_00200 [Candidatus Babeliales bacterium]|nr:hypothetical protein [Candidatus Babeliales bacterium]